MSTDMSPFDERLDQARQRGRASLPLEHIEAGLTNMSVYAAAVSAALELAKLKQTEKRDLLLIENYYNLKQIELQQEISLIERSMIAEFSRDESIRTNTFRMIELLLQSGNADLAMEMFSRLMDGIKHSALDKLLDSRDARLRNMKY